ncbi:hypothetical protein ACFX13_037949 [Malus domestica]
MLHHLSNYLKFPEQIFLSRGIKELSGKGGRRVFLHRGIGNEFVAVAPRILTILGYFWPLFASTTIFLVAVIAFGGVSQLSTESHGEAQGQGIIDYVAGQPDYTN